MNDLIPALMTGLLGLGSGIFVTLSLIERPVWRLMRQPRFAGVPDDTARVIHGALKRVIHLLPPTMMATMAGVTALVIWQVVLTGYAPGALVVAAVFFGQLVLVVSRLGSRIRAVNSVPSEGDIGAVRDGLGALALLHHQGFAMTATTLLAQWLYLFL